MKKKQHLQTKFLNFLLERQKQIENDGEEGDVNIPLPDDGEDLPPMKKNLRLKPIEIPFIEEDEEESEDEDTEVETETGSDDEILERLLIQYRKLKKEYDNKLHQRKRR
jgi:hypothetical protein